jgi:hypothetical protein
MLISSQDCYWQSAEADGSRGYAQGTQGEIVVQSIFSHFSELFAQCLSYDGNENEFIHKCHREVHGFQANATPHVLYTRETARHPSSNSGLIQAEPHLLYFAAQRRANHISYTHDS